MEPDPANPQGGPDNSGTSVIDDKGNFVENWADNYPEEDRATLSRFKKFDDLITSHMKNRRMLNKDPDSLVEIPSETSSDEVKAEFHRRRGVPDDEKGYKYKRSKDLSDNIDIDDEKIAAFAQIAKKHNMTPSQFNGIVNDYLALVDKDIAKFDLLQQDRNKKDFEKADAALKKKFGKSYDERVARANMILRKYEGQNFVAKHGLENSPEMTEFLDRIAEDMSEDRIKGLTGVTVPTPSQVDSKIKELRAHPAYLDRKHPQHKDYVNQVRELYKKKSA